MFRSGLLLAALTACGRIGFSSADELADAAPGDSDSANVPAGSIIAFHFDENTGTTTTSAGTVLVGTLNDTGWTDGVRGAAIALGAAGFVDLPVSSALQLTGDVTISIWYFLERALSPGECVNLVIHGSAGGSGAIDNDVYAFNLVEPGFVLYSERQTQIPNGVGSPPIPEAFTPNVWHHAIAKRNATSVGFHLDGGTEIAGLAPPGTIDGGTAGHLRIGADVELSQCGSFPGAIDELYIYPRFLDDAEARTLFDER